MLINEASTVRRGRHYNNELFSPDGTVILLTPRHLSKSKALTFSGDESKLFLNQIDQNDLIQPGDILINTIGGDLDKTANFYVYNLPFAAVISEHLIRLTPNNEYLIGIGETRELSEIIESNYYRIKLLATGRVNLRISNLDIETFDLE